MGEGGWNACLRSSRRCKDGLCTFHSNPPYGKDLFHHSHGQDKVVVLGKGVVAKDEEEEGEDKQTCDLCMRARVLDLDREADNGFCHPAEVDTPPPAPPPDPFLVRFLIPERECVFLRERNKLLALRSTR